MKNKYLSILLMIIIAVGVALLNYVHEIPTENNLLSVYFLDVGQGDAIYIRAPNGNDMLIDGGPTDAVLRQLRLVMPSFDHELDLVVETHPDKDHIAGLAYVFDEYQVKKFLASEIQSGTSFDKALQERITTEPELEKILARRGTRIILDPDYGVFIDILFPDENTSEYKETNAASIIQQLTYGDIQFIFTGDAPVSKEKLLVANNSTLLPSEVLQLGHHGSKTSTSQEWIERINPKFVVASAGKNNSYGHPVPEIITRATQFGAQSFVTAELGTIHFESDGISVWRR